MNVIISAKKMNLGENFNEYANKKLSGKLDRFFGEGTEAKITASAFRDVVTLELTVKHDNLIFRAEQSAAEKTDALDACIDRIVRQIRKNKTKVEKRLHSSAFNESYADVIEEQTEFNIIKKKQFVLRPMTVDEAVLQMNMLGHTFFMFKNGGTGETNVVYKRDDGNYSLLEPVKD
ncbi:MAG: ribosome-associated translation inhibitor RaiA [Oscillospiraceae bacterium]|jgi:putative sigma-54 modulation protein|nr:ribosome-associated translation inhibitor RaiA [Oscillospiraceae bacterium]